MKTETNKNRWKQIDINQNLNQNWKIFQEEYWRSVKTKRGLAQCCAVVM